MMRNAHWHSKIMHLPNTAFQKKKYPKFASSSSSSPSSPTSHGNLAIAKIHLGMTPLKLLQYLMLLRLLARRQPQRLLPLIVHHLLHRLSRLAVQIAQLRIFRLDFANVDFGISRTDGIPPFGLIVFLEGEDEFIAVFDGPEGVVDDDGVGEGIVDYRGE
mmetsp:Transcript_25487/g.43507  ORF Transcript_25487/g.43507 Transcript_25487/m.43507 type:complete len:160 (-) Transcript_25487:237-716(-)